MKPNELKLGIVIRGPLLPEPIEVLVATALDDRRRSCRPRSLARIDFGSAHLHAGEAAHGRTPDRDRGSAPPAAARVTARSTRGLAISALQLVKLPSGGKVPRG